jgi:hypothetical protein
MRLNAALGVLMRLRAEGFARAVLKVAAGRVSHVLRDTPSGHDISIDGLAILLAVKEDLRKLRREQVLGVDREATTGAIMLLGSE